MPTYLKDSEHGDGERIKVGRRCSVRKVESSSKQLHAQQCKYKNEEEKKQQQRNDGLHRTEQGYHQVP